MDKRRQTTYLASRLAVNVREQRERLRISQEDLAARCGLHRTYVGDIERAERNVSLATLEALAQGLGQDPSDLISRYVRD